MASLVCTLDAERLDVLRPCMADDDFLEDVRRYVPFDPFADPDGFPLCCLSKRTVVYSCGMIVRHGEVVAHDHPPGELEVCRRLAGAATKVMERVPVGMGSEGTPIDGSDYFQPFFVTANQGAAVPKVLTENHIRAAFGGVIYPACDIRVEPLCESGVWWGVVLSYYNDSEDEYFAEMLDRWRKMVNWFNSQREFIATAFVMIGDGPDDGGATFPRLALGLTQRGSLAGIIGCVVHS